MKKLISILSLGALVVMGTQCSSPKPAESNTQTEAQKEFRIIRQLAEKQVLKKIKQRVLKRGVEEVIFFEACSF